jgi:hypothetical protein
LCDIAEISFSTTLDRYGDFVLFSAVTLVALRHNPVCFYDATNSLTTGSECGSLNAHSITLGLAVGEQDSISGEDAERVTPKMFIEVIRGKGTPEEEELVRKALANPHSPLNDWIDHVEEWAEKSFGRKNSSSLAAAGILAEAVARRHREDVVAFFERKRSEGELTEEDLSKLLTAGALDSNKAPSAASEDYARAVTSMLQLAVALHPEFASDIASLSKTRAQFRE